jgi:hypothetical protein
MKKKTKKKKKKGEPKKWRGGSERNEIFQL